MRRAGWVPLLLLGAGVALVVDAVLRGSASVALVAIVPVVSGSSVEFLGGVVLLLVGILSLPFAFLSGEESGAPGTALAAPRRGETPTEEVGGLILIGPVPIFFGRWKDVSLRTKMIAALVGGAVLVLAVVVFLRG